MVQKSLNFSVCTQMKHCGYIEPHLAKLDTSEQQLMLEIHGWQRITLLFSAESFFLIEFECHVK
jgi:hypothetical protein